jgi:hypothetical protein
MKYAREDARIIKPKGGGFMRIKIFILLSSLTVLSSSSRAEDIWKLKGFAGLTFNQTAVSSNWSGTEKNSSNWGLKFEASGERNTLSSNWLNTLKEEYGMNKVSGSAVQKSADSFDFSSVFSWKPTEVVNPYVYMIATTQHEEFFRPGTLSESAGLMFLVINRQKHHLKTRAGASERQIFDKTHHIVDPVTYIVSQVSAADNPSTPGIETLKKELGAEWITNYDVELMQNISFVSEARVFTAFNNGANLRWDNSLFVKLSNIFTMQFGYLAIYNNDKNPRPSWPSGIETRFTTTIGASYNLF